MGFSLDTVVLRAISSRSAVFLKDRNQPHVKA
jgi:hypothetical protein